VLVGSLTAAVYKLYLHNLTTSATTTMRIIKTMTPATAMPAASTTESDEELASRESRKTFTFYNECEFVWACVACQTDTLHLL
jgi:hypothetical protein